MKKVFLFILFIPFLIFPQEKSFHSSEGAVFILDKATTKLFSTGVIETTIHQKINIVGEKGKKFAELQIPFDSERQKVKINFAYTITPENKVLKISSKDIKIVTPAELVEFAVLYPGIKTMTVTFPGVEIGSILEYQYKITTFKPQIKNHFWDEFYFQSTEPFVQSIYILEVPKNKKIFYKEYGVELKEKQIKENSIIYIWEKQNVPSIIPEPNMPSLEEFIPRIYVTTFEKWEEIKNWFYETSKGCFVETSEMKKLVSELTENKSFEEKIANIYHYVSSNIRYVGLEMGIHGYKPHQSDEVFNLKYGDCKDKATLMITMLKIAGIEGFLTLIHTEKKLNKEIPSPGQFNHAIVSIPYNNKYLFLDPTSEVFRFPNLPPSDQNKGVLIISPDKQTLAETPLFSPENNLKKRVSEAYIDENGNLKTDVKIIPSGIFEAVLKSNFRYLKEIERERSLSAELNNSLPGSNLLKIDIKGVEDVSLPVEETYSFYTKNYGIKVGDKIIFQPGLLDKINTKLVSQETRNFPIKFDFLWQNEEIVKYKIPESFKIETIPPAKEIKTEFSYFSVKIEKEDSSLIYHRIFTINIPEISPQLYPEFKKFYEDVSYQDRLPVILTK